MRSQQVPAKALICDDERGSLLVLESMMESLSIETVSAASVADAKKILAEYVPRFAILDVLLPDGDGVDVLLHIRAAGLATPVALITATLSEFPYFKCGTQLPDMIFSKPLEMGKVSEWIGNIAPADVAESQLTLNISGCPILNAPDRGERLSIEAIVNKRKGSPTTRHAVVLRSISPSEIEILCGDNLPVGTQFILPIRHAAESSEAHVRCVVIHCETGGWGGSQFILRAAFGEIVESVPTASAA